jgi:hypothetical protein
VTGSAGFTVSVFLPLSDPAPFPAPVLDPAPESEDPQPAKRAAQIKVAALALYHFFIENPFPPISWMFTIFSIIIGFQHELECQSSDVIIQSYDFPCQFFHK